MTKTIESHTNMMLRRGELLAELFLQDLSPSFVAKSPPDVRYDYLVGFPNSNGGVNYFAVEVKVTEQPIVSKFPIKKSLYKYLANSNIPVLLLVINVKKNRLFYAWLTHETSELRPKSNQIKVPVSEINDKRKKEIRLKLAA